MESLAGRGPTVVVQAADFSVLEGVNDRLQLAAAEERLTEAHGGEVSVQSAPGEGTTVTMEKWLP